MISFLLRTVSLHILYSVNPSFQLEKVVKVASERDLEDGARYVGRFKPAAVNKKVNNALHVRIPTYRSNKARTREREREKDSL